MATIEEIAQAEKEYADVTARSGCVEFVDKSLNVCCTAIAILQERLHEMGYPVSSPITPPKKEACLSGLHGSNRIQDLKFLPCSNESGP